MSGSKMTAFLLTMILLAAGGMAVHAAFPAAEAARCHVIDAEFSPDARSVITTSGQAVIWDAKTGALLRILPDSPDDDIVTAEYSPNGQYIATGGWHVVIWDARTGRMLRTIRHHYAPHFSPDSTSFLTLHDDQAFVWDLVTGHLLRTLTDTSDGIDGASYSADGQFILTYNVSGITVWGTETGAKVQTIETYNVSRAQYSPNGLFILTVSDGLVLVWSALTWEKVAQIGGIADWAFHAKYSPSGRYIVATSDERFEGEGYVDVIDTETYTVVYWLEGHTETVLNASFSPDEKSIVTASWDGRAIIWDVASRRAKHSLNGCL